jgi:hypothetical protein
MKTEDEVKAIALQDARRAYRNLELYDIKAVRRQDVWEVSFTFKDENLDGGGPYYEIDPETGAIINRIYYQ